MVGDSPRYATTNPANMTCYLGMQSRAFKKASPDRATRADCQSRTPPDPSHAARPIGQPPRPLASAFSQIWPSVAPRANTLLFSSARALPVRRVATPATSSKDRQQ